MSQKQPARPVIIPKKTTSDQMMKIAPSAIEIEEAVLGAMMLERSGLLIAMNVLKQKDVFYKQQHQLIFEAIQNLFQDGKVVDILTITAELRKLGTIDQVGGAHFVSELPDRVNSSVNLEAHIRILQEMWIRRIMIGISANNMQSAYEDTNDVFELMEKSARQLVKLQEQLSIKKGQTGKSIYMQTMDSMLASMDTPGMTGLACGILEIDKITAGWQKQDLIIIAARPGMGKTAYLMSCIRYPTVVLNKKVVVFSLEMSAVQLMMRMIASETEMDISMAQIRQGRISKEQYTQIQTESQKLYNDNLIIDDTAGISIFELRSKCISLKLKYPDIAMICIDYLQLMSGEGNHGNREQEISVISRSLKMIAKELDVPIIALSQLSRMVETRSGEKRPQLSDLRESGAIEQDADMVQFIYRPQYYKIDLYEDGTSTRGMADIIFAKHRNGSLETVTIGFDERKVKFHSLQSDIVLPVDYNPNKFIEPGSIDRFESF